MIIFAEDHYVAIKNNEVIGVVERSSEHGRWRWAPLKGNGIDYVNLSFALDWARRECE